VGSLSAVAHSLARGWLPALGQITAMAQNTPSRRIRAWKSAAATRSKVVVKKIGNIGFVVPSRREMRYDGAPIHPPTPKGAFSGTCFF
jgi:hypothetical protein